MTKNEIYERVVRLTTELAQTKVAEKIFNAAIEGDVVKTQTIIASFPVYYPELYQKIVDFGKEFNKLVGDSEEDKEDFKKLLGNCEIMMYNLAQTKVIAQIAKAAETGDSTKIQEVIDTFKKDSSVFAENLLNFQEEFTKYFDEHQTGNEGSIFGTETDEENGVFLFDTNIIDALSFYLLTILGNIADIYFFCDDEEGNLTSADKFFDAIQDATNEAFAEFVASYNLVDWVGRDKKYQSVGKILVAALADEFEEQIEEDTEEQSK